MRNARVIALIIPYTTPIGEAILEISRRKNKPKNPVRIIKIWYLATFWPLNISINITKIGYEKTSPMPTATLLSSIDLNIVDQWIANKGPKTNPELNNCLVMPLCFRTNNNKNSDPKNVLIPTSESELIFEVLIIRGIVPQETAKRLIKK